VGADGFGEEVSAVVVAFWLTTCEIAGEDVLVLNVPSPLYVAVMLCGEPTVSGYVNLQVATPPAVSAWLPASQTIVVAPSLNVTVPVNGPVTTVAEVTVAVYVTVRVGDDGLSEDTSAVVVPDLLTTCGSPVNVPVLVVKLESPG